MILKNRKNKHINYVKDHIFTLHRKLTEEIKDIDNLKGKELNKKVKDLQNITSRMKECQKYLKLILF